MSRPMVDGSVKSADGKSIATADGHDASDPLEAAGGEIESPNDDAPTPAVPDSSVAETAAATSFSLCDGTQNIRMVFRVSGGGQIEAGRIVMVENGWSLLMIRGDCTFWTYGNSWDGVRTGVLTKTEETQFEKDVRLDQWAAWSGTWYQNVCDGPDVLYRAGNSAITLHSSCTSVPLPLPFQPNVLDLAISAWINNLLAAPEVTGPVHVVVYRYDVPDPLSYPDVQWSLQTPLSSIAISQAQATSLGPGKSSIVVDPDASALRTLRDSFKRGEHGLWSYGLLPFKDSQGNRYGLYFRDAMPFETVQGLLSCECPSRQ